MGTSDNNFIIITGASQGLGKEFARTCAQKGKDLILISLPKENIKNLALELSFKFKVSVYYYETDLTNQVELDQLIEKINQKHQIEVLINNAGIGGSRRFEEASEEYIQNIINLNVLALVKLTRGLLPNLKNKREAHILNISSVAAFGAMPFKTVYPASKAFVESFSLGLNEELKDSCVKVSVAHPGGMPTNEIVAQRIKQHSNILIRNTILSPSEVAEICLEEMYKGKARIIPGLMNRVCRYLIRMCPDKIRLPMVRRNLLQEINMA
ncbi:SDR family NAD(P)-dependent oxidoreductase [Flammeovirga yaeyamensis]|uniref:SDR family NAD(P)-dependent oxidoreductase n=1 Tax=Flammeovirga yaeyamensis TaxID=367791 RepID=A0AAX1N100_9BACT|nr:SDR family NAD(P)-dependent oxidoreductase [Flammeovirga yaeyamensis]MBB3698373.1 hypothetical protein [Flammeovirga yaeyamensis]NMF34275.1 SDR family NAD(P)-dependent oxidoreductase [Flammeovirga yaeyamensis]QWG01258.1 SDR family NAD(P)-dependent oxidoreductase [Flammeovirga yaeyamensis]